MLRRISAKRNQYSDYLSANDFYSPIQSYFDSRLAERGFVRPRQDVWVKENCKSARPMIELWHLKGAISAPVWGFALNYVPHFNNSFTKLVWHRTIKSARLDVFPFDEFSDELNLTRFASPQEHTVTVNRVLGSALGRATDFFADFQSTEDLLPLFERLRSYKGRGLGYWDYSNVPVAQAFTLRVNGDIAGGKAILDEYVRRMSITGPAAADLWNRFEQAKT